MDETREPLLTEDEVNDLLSDDDRDAIAEVGSSSISMAASR
ncbi:hypothetical protein OG930_43320 [Streptomyces sp. NBC_01799]|nr:hypothetical protein [Streptomyces sp. NBC_01800]WSA73214.1 hypothetical protein OIE65_43960 [Streptomyces sp. NBC_01800]WSA81731.1 hypothetical protein OG930_43320 [Streptomyces sp. NBC_01799]